MIAWTLLAARASRSLTETLVSTDDDEIAAVAAAHGGLVPFRRPPELATDSAEIVAVLRHAVEWWEAARAVRVSAVVLLQPTSPLRSADDIDAAVDVLFSSGCDSVQTVALDEDHPWHKFLLGSDGRLALLNAEARRYSRRQEAPPLYRPTGSVYAVRRTVLMEGGLLHGADERGVVCPPERSVDVDDEADVALAEHYLAACAKAKG